MLFENNSFDWSRWGSEIDLNRSHIMFSAYDNIFRHIIWIVLLTRIKRRLIRLHAGDFKTATFKCTPTLSILSHDFQNFCLSVFNSINLYWIKTKLKEDVTKQPSVHSRNHPLDKHNTLNIYYASTNSLITKTRTHARYWTLSTEGILKAN